LINPNQNKQSKFNMIFLKK